MGKKQRLKKQKGQVVKPAAPGGRGTSWSAWVVGIAVFFALAIAGIIGFVQMNKARFVRISVLTSGQTIQEALQKSRSQFTMDDRDRLEKIISGTLAMARADKKLDPKLGGHLMFILKVTEEIIRQGSVAPGELEKLEMLLSEGLRIQVLDRQQQKPE